MFDRFLSFRILGTFPRRLRRDQGSPKHLLILARRNQDLCTETLVARIWVFLEIAASALLCSYSAYQVPDNLVTGSDKGGSSEASLRAWEPAHLINITFSEPSLHASLTRKIVTWR